MEHCKLKSCILPDIVMVSNEIELDGQRMLHTCEEWDMLRKVGR